MTAHEITESVLTLPEDDRLELARRIVESVAADRRVGEAVSEGVRRIEEVVTARCAVFRRRNIARPSDEAAPFQRLKPADLTR